MNKPREEEKEIDNKIKKLCDEFNYSWKDWEDYFPTGIKKLLDQALSSQRAELLEKIEKFSEGIGCEKNPRWVLSEVKKIIGGKEMNKPREGKNE